MVENEEKIIVGSEEWCSFDSLGVPLIKARVDSGAKTSSIHAFNIHTFKRKTVPWVSFEVHPLQNDRRTVVRCEHPIFDKRTVKSSNGTSEKRYVILTPMTLSGHSWDIELTLTNRDSMGYRMLLGREAMHGRILVDPSERNILGDKSDPEILAAYGEIDKAQSGLTIGLLANDPEVYSNRRILEAGEERGHEMIFLNIKHCYIKLDAEAPEIHYRGGRILNDLDAVITRVPPDLTFYGCALARHFESIGVYTLNSSEAISKSSDRLFSLQLLLQNGLEIPTTGFANSPTDTDDLIDMVGGAPLIVKLLEGSQGKGVVLAETRKASESVINAFKSLRADLLVQEFVKEAEGKDLRLFVIDGKVVASVQRTAAPGEFRANIQEGGSVTVTRTTAAERNLAIKAAKALGLKVAGVNIIRSHDGPLLLEVNSSPGLEVIEQTTGKDIAGYMISAVEKQQQWKRMVSSQEPLPRSLSN
ncbi:MAG: 30S ribosomal protein S6--L-glutamate ligase [Gammaproteobacteria bacterium]